MQLLLAEHLSPTGQAVTRIGRSLTGNVLLWRTFLGDQLVARTRMLANLPAFPI
jgi:hypothetical protein